MRPRGHSAEPARAAADPSRDRRTRHRHPAHAPAGGGLLRLLAEEAEPAPHLDLVAPEHGRLPAAPVLAHAEPRHLPQHRPGRRGFGGGARLRRPLRGDLGGEGVRRAQRDQPRPVRRASPRSGGTGGVRPAARRVRRRDRRPAVPAEGAPVPVRGGGPARARDPGAATPGGGQGAPRAEVAATGRDAGDRRSRLVRGIPRGHGDRVRGDGRLLHAVAVRGVTAGAAGGPHLRQGGGGRARARDHRRARRRRERPARRRGGPCQPGGGAAARPPRRVRSRHAPAGARGGPRRIRRRALPCAPGGHLPRHVRHRGPAPAASAGIR